MIVIDTPLEHGGEPVGSIKSTGSRDFLTKVVGGKPRFHFNSAETSHIVQLPEVYAPDHYRAGPNDREASDGLAATSQLIQALHGGFAGHHAVSLNPTTFWYTIVHEVAEFIRQNPDEYAGMFTGTPSQQQKIIVRDDSLRYDGASDSDWTRSITLIRDKLADRLAGGVADLFLPDFAISTIADEAALLVALMDVVSPYYKYEWLTLCGIPQIRLEGTANDWQQLYSSTERLLANFAGLQFYRDNLLPVLEKIAHTAAGEIPDYEFWRSIYKYKGGSGGPHVNGWITKLFAYTLTSKGFVLLETQRRSYGYSTNEFPAHIGVVPFVWRYFGREIPMQFVTGITHVDHEGGFLSPQLGVAVIEPEPAS